MIEEIFICGMCGGENLEGCGCDTVFDPGPPAKEWDPWDSAIRAATDMARDLLMQRKGKLKEAYFDPGKDKLSVGLTVIFEEGGGADLSGRSKIKFVVSEVKDEAPWRVTPQMDLFRG